MPVPSPALGARSMSWSDNSGTPGTPVASSRVLDASASDITLGGSPLMAGSALMTLIEEKEEEFRKQHAEAQATAELVSRSKQELAQLTSSASVTSLREQHLTRTTLPSPESSVDEMEESASGEQDLERPATIGHPPFYWRPSEEYAKEFELSGEWGHVITKLNDFEDQGWVIPVGGSLKLTKGAIFRWTLRIEKTCPSRPQLQIGVHGLNHCLPWRMITTSRCSWSRDEEDWQDRAGGDRLIEEGSLVHVEVDLRGVHAEQGTLSLAIEDEPYEQFFDDIPLDLPHPLIPVVAMGGAGSSVRLCPIH